MKTILKQATAGVALCALLLARPAPAAARVTVTVEFAYGGLAACGVGFFLYFASSWEVPFAARRLQGPLLELSDGQAHLGVPIPSFRLGGDPSGEQVAHDAIQLDLLRWRF